MTYAGMDSQLVRGFKFFVDGIKMIPAWCKIYVKIVQIQRPAILLSAARVSVLVSLVLILTPSSEIKTTRQTFPSRE